MSTATAWPDPAWRNDAIAALRRVSPEPDGLTADTVRSYVVMTVGRQCQGNALASIRPGILSANPEGEWIEFDPTFVYPEPWWSDPNLHSTSLDTWEYQIGHTVLKERPDIAAAVEAFVEECLACQKRRSMADQVDLYAIYVPAADAPEDWCSIGVALCDRPERLSWPKRGPEVGRTWLSTGVRYEPDRSDVEERGVHLISLDDTHGFYSMDHELLRNLGILLRFGTEWYDSSVDRMIVLFGVQDMRERVLDLYAWGQTEVALAGGTLYVVPLAPEVS